MNKSSGDPYDSARNRKPQTIEDCELLNIDLRVIERCKTQMQVDQAYRDDIANSPYMSGEELRRLLVGRTSIAIERYPDRGLGAVVLEPYHIYFAPDGEYFIMQGRVQDTSSMRDRGRYEFVRDSICYPLRRTSCDRMRKVGDELIVTAPGGKDFIVTAVDGDPLSVVEQVSIWKPKPIDPTPPAGAEDVAGPRL